MQARRPESPYRASKQQRLPGRASAARLLWAHVSRGLAFKLWERRQRRARAAAPPVYVRPNATRQRSGIGASVYGVLLLLGTFHAMANATRKPKPPPVPLIKTLPQPAVPDVYFPTTFVELEQQAPWATPDAPWVPPGAAPAAASAPSPSPSAPSPQPRDQARVQEQAPLRRAPAAPLPVDK